MKKRASSSWMLSVELRKVQCCFRWPQQCIKGVRSQCGTAEARARCRLLRGKIRVSDVNPPIT